MPGGVAPVALVVVPIVQNFQDLFLIQEGVWGLFPLEPRIVGPTSAFLYGTRGLGARMPEAIVPDLTRRVIGKIPGDVRIEATLLSEVSPLDDQR